MTCPPRKGRSRPSSPSPIRPAARCSSAWRTRTRHVRGVSDALDLEERLASLVSDRISPRLVPEIEILPWRRSQVLAVQVHPSPSRPHYLIREGPTAGVYVRVGSTNRRADAELIEELRRFARGEGFDEQPMPGLDSEALDFRAASESFAPFRTLARRDLETLRLVTDHQGRKVPTVGGMILFGGTASATSRTPGSRPAASRVDKSRIIDRAEIRSFPCPPSKRRSLSCRSTPSTAPRSARCAGRSAGACPPGRARGRDQRGGTPTMPSAVLPSPVDLRRPPRGREPGLLPFGLTSKTYRAASRSCAIA